MAMKERFNWIDWSKSLCMFLVVLGHCHVVESQQVVSQVIYSFHIPLFFFLSGLLCPKILSLSSLKKDLRYLILPYFVYGFLLMAVFTCLSMDFSLDSLWHRIQALCLGYDASIGAIWFLPALFICKQLYFFCRWILTKSRVLGCVIAFSTIMPAYFIAHGDVNLPLFADSALFGLPFFLLGSFSLPLIEKWKNVGAIPLSLSTVFLMLLTIFLAVNNGFVSLATCDYGTSFIVYYLCAIAGIASITSGCLLLDSYRLRFVTVTSYGTIVTLGIHGLLLMMLQYYIPVLLGYYTPTLILPVAVLYAAITYTLCFFVIQWADRYCPHLMGLKGVLNRLK